MNKLQKLTASAPIAAGTTLLLSGQVSAAPPDPGGTGAAMGDTADGAVSWVENFGVPGIVSVILLGIGIRLLFKFSKRATGAV